MISPEQLFVGTIRKGESGVEFKNVYSNRENRSMFDGMADALTKIRLASPGQDSQIPMLNYKKSRRWILVIGGMLIFHPTYSLMNIANDYWRVKEPHNQLLGNNQFQCRIFNEPKSRAEMDAMNLIFEQTIEEDPSTGAIYQGKDSHVTFLSLESKLLTS